MGDIMTTARIQFTTAPAGRDLRADMADFLQWMESECGEISAAVEHAAPRDALDRAIRPEDETGPVLSVNVKACDPGRGGR